MTMAEVAEHMGRDPDTVSAVIRTARKRHPGKVFRVVSYRRTYGQWGQDKAVYAAEVGADVPKPKVDAVARKNESNARWRARHGVREAAKKRAKRAGGMPVVNIWNGLAPASMRNVMTMAAANTAMAQAA